MPVILSKKYSISGQYTSEEIEIYKQIIDDVRLRVADDDPDLNVLNNKIQQYNDNIIIQLANMVLRDLNSGIPRTRYTIPQMWNTIDPGLLIDGIVVFSLLREGILQLRNQIDFNDSGLSISMFNKTGIYQSWYGMMLQDYLRKKADLKAAAIPRSANSGFLGIGTEFGYRTYR